MLEAADAIESFPARTTRAQCADDDLVRSAVLQKLIVIGEAANRVSDSVRDRNRDVPWPDIIAFRNVAVHASFGLDWSIVWATAVDEVPALRRQIQEVLDREG